MSPSTYKNNEPDKPHLFITLRNGDFGYSCVIWGDEAILDGNTPCPTGTYVQLSQRKRPGSVVGETGQPMMYHIGYYPPSKAWWIQYGDEWIGYVNDGLWSNTGGFAAGNTVQWQGEVAFRPGLGNCVAMGNGLPAEDPDSASISYMSYEIMEGDQSILYNAEANISKVSDNRYWTAAHLSQNGGGINGFHYGGLGPCAG